MKKIIYLLLLLLLLSCGKNAESTESSVDNSSTVDSTASMQDTITVNGPAPDPAEKSKSDYFEKLKPTAIVYHSSFLKRNESLLKCNDKIIKTLKNKLSLEEGEYKYLYLGNENYAIITNKQCITKDGKIIKSSKTSNSANCEWYDFTCVEEGYSQFYILSITKKGKVGDKPFKETEFLNHYNNEVLDCNWRAIPELNTLLKNPANTFNEDYSFIVKYFKIQKVGLAKATLITDTNSDYKTIIKNLFSDKH